MPVKYDFLLLRDLERNAQIRFGQLDILLQPVGNCRRLLANDPDQRLALRFSSFYPIEPVVIALESRHLIEPLRRFA